MMADNYPPHMQALFREIRAHVTAYLAAHRDLNCPEGAVLAILGEHIAICFALIDDEAVREEAMRSWVADLPRAVDGARDHISRAGGTLQ